MSRIGKKLILSMEELFIERAIEIEENKPLDGSVDAIIADVEENTTNDTIVEDDTDTGLPDPEPAPATEPKDEPIDTSTDTETKDDPVEEPSVEEKDDKKKSSEEDENIDSAKGDKAKDKAEEESDKADKASKTGKALEEIAELLEQTTAIGGLDPIGADVLNMSTNAITNSLGVAVETIDPELFKSYSKRQQYTLESIENVKKTSIEIFKKVIAFIKKIMQHLKEAYRFYNSELLNTKNRFDKVKDIHKGSLKVEPNEDRIKNNLPNVLLRTGKNDSIEVVLVAEETYQMLVNYVTSYRKDLTNTVATIEDFKEKVFKIDLVNEENLLTRFVKKDLVQFGQFFGVSLIDQLNKVNTVKGLNKPTDTIACYESELLAGRYRITAFVPNKINLLTEDILESKVLFKPNTDQLEYEDGVEVCGIGDFRQLFSVIDNLFTLNRRIGAAIDEADKQSKKLLDYVEASEKGLTKFITGNLEKANIETNINTGPQILRDLLISFKNFYVDPIGICLRYTSRYIRGLVMYAEISTKQYQ